MTTPALLHTQALSIGYPSRGGSAMCLAEGLNLSLQPGKLVCLLGRNGAGKSTLIRTLAALHLPLTGTLLWGSEAPRDMTARARARYAAVVLTHNESLGIMTSEEVVALGRYPHTDWLGKLSKRDRQVIDRVFENTGASAYRHRIVETLSDGERQRVFIARALAQETRLLFLDEPTAFLDLPGRASLMLLLKKIACECPISIVLSTHDLALALEVADELWIQESRTQFHRGTPKELIENKILETLFAADGIYLDPATGALKLLTQPRP